MSSGEIILLTGSLSSGKTSFCLDLAQLAKKKGLDVAGIISPAVFTESQKTAIDALDLRLWERKRLADLRTSEKVDLGTKRWSFHPSAVQWGNQVIADAVPCDLLIIDELGPLEFDRSEGWVEGFSAVESREYQLAVVVIRPSLLNSAREGWDISREINLDLPGTSNPSYEEILTLLDQHGKGKV